MASPIELKLTNRCMLISSLCPPVQTLTATAPKQPIRKLPSSVSILDDTTIEGLKVLVAKSCGISDYNRIGIFDATTKKTFKNRKARLSDEPTIIDAAEVLVKDLGKLSPLAQLLHILIIHAQALNSAGEPST